jgi:hypothetical protein
MPRGWMYRFNGGPLDGVVGGPFGEIDPPELMLAGHFEGEGLAIHPIDVWKDEYEDYKCPDDIDTGIYERVTMSDMPDEVYDGLPESVQETLVRGAEYRVVAA